ncbi:MAG: hypothetical protein Q9211_000411 [Gyalolechia sp. 1 TL-2023]
MVIKPSTYWTKDNRQTAALIRARQPFLIKNIFTGLGLAAFTISVCKCYIGSWSKSRTTISADDSGTLDAFTIRAVAQDDFSDVQVPNAPEQPPHTPHTGVLKAPPEVAVKK